MRERLDEVGELILAAARQARAETDDAPEPGLAEPVQWPIQCLVGPGLEGAIACESGVGYVNGTKGWLIYRGYDIFDLCAYSSFEEVAYLLLHGSLPTNEDFLQLTDTLANYRCLPATLRRLMSFPVETMKPMAALRLGTNLCHQEFTVVDRPAQAHSHQLVIGTDEDSMPMETTPRGSEHALYEIKSASGQQPSATGSELTDPVGWHACYHLISGLATITAAIGRLQAGLMPIDPDPHLSHAANFLYMLTGQEPTPLQERLMDVSLILHADHGMNASTFAAMVVASTQADMYFSVGAGISALSGPLHGGANELSLRTLKSIGQPSRVDAWYEKSRAEGTRIPGFGHRVYRAYDPRARVLAPLARYLSAGDNGTATLFATAEALEKRVIADLGADKGVFPNVDFYSGLVYAGLGISPSLFTPAFAISRVAGWTARVQEYLRANRIFRPRAIYSGPLRKEYVPIANRHTPVD